MVSGKCDNSLDTHLGKHKNLISNIVREMAKNHLILPMHSNVTNKVGLTLAGPPCMLPRKFPDRIGFAVSVYTNIHNFVEITSAVRTMMPNI